MVDENKPAPTPVSVMLRRSLDPRVKAFERRMMEDNALLKADADAKPDGAGEGQS